MQSTWIVGLAFLASSCAGPSAEAVVETADPSSAEDITSPFHGSWTLVSWTDTNEDGEEFSPFGEDAFGRIVYAPSGKMAVVLMGQRRGDVDTALGLDALDPEEMRTALTHFFAYSGSFTDNEEAQTITHHIEAALAPGWIGGDRVRSFEMIGDARIVLRPQEGTRAN